MSQYAAVLSFADQFLDLTNDSKAVFQASCEGGSEGNVEREVKNPGLQNASRICSKAKGIQVTPYLIDLNSGRGNEGPPLSPLTTIADLQFDPISAALESYFNCSDSIENPMLINSPPALFGIDTGENGSSGRSSEQHACPSCDLYFKRKDSLTLHYRLHTGIRPFFCPDPGCGQAFFSKTARTRHQSSHRVEKDFHCPNCPKKFKMADGLLKHAKKHSPASFACHICDRRFRRKDNLTVHLLTHSQEKKYKCQICHKQFRQRSGLSFHMRAHEIPRPFKCSLCDKTFSERTSLTKHISFHEDQAEKSIE